MGAGERGSLIKAAGGERSLGAGPASPPACRMHPRSSRATVQVPVTFSLRSRPHAAAEGGAPGLSRAESCVPGTLGWARKPLLGRRLQNHRTTEGWEGQGMAAGLGQDQNQPRWAQNPYPSALGTGRAEGTGVSARCILDSVPQVSLPPLPNDPSVTRLSQLSPSLLGLHGGPCWACVLVFTDLDSRGPHKTHVSRAPALG